MQIVFTYTIPHTGTHFVMDLQHQGIPRDQCCKVDDMWWGQRYKDGKSFEDYEFDAPITGHQVTTLLRKMAKPNDQLMNKWDNLKLLLIKGHHWHRGKQLMEILHHHDPVDMHFVSPLRDPFLAIMTRSWQGWYAYGKKAHEIRPLEQRKREARRITQTYVDMLTTQPARVFLFPIDGEQSKTPNGRRTLAKRLYKHCGLTYGDAAQKFVNEWKPVNISQSKSEGAGQEKAYHSFEIMKQEYASGNIKFIKENKFCNFEFEFLQGEEWLKKLLENAGYNNLPWW